MLGYNVGTGEKVWGHYYGQFCENYLRSDTVVNVSCVENCQDIDPCKFKFCP